MRVSATTVAIRLDAKTLRQAAILGGLEEMFKFSPNDLSFEDTNPDLPLIKLHAQRGITNAIAHRFEQEFPTRYEDAPTAISEMSASNLAVSFSPVWMVNPNE